MQIWLKYKNPDLTKIAVWSYFFSWNYTPVSFLEQINKWPNIQYTSLKILEWWGIYDIDDYLTNNGFISKWDFIFYTTNKENIKKLSDKYGFLDSDYDSLEWFLYPDTYFVDIKKDIISQLVFLQLKNFQEKIWLKYSVEFENFNNKLSQNWFTNLKFTKKWIITLASIIQQEEKTTKNRPIIAWLFLNRLKDWIRLDADVSLCYGLKIIYKNCRSQIVPNLYDKNNKYNTRQNVWLTPWPISNPDEDSVRSLLFFEKTDFYFYLHDNNWKIHFAKDNNWHNFNKNKFLK